jgi:hypothetical protein
VVGVVVVVVGVEEVDMPVSEPESEEEPDVELDEVEEVDVEVDEAPVVAVDPVVPEVVVAEWATVSEATSTPSPAAPAAAVSPMAAVSRRSFLWARSRARAARSRSAGCWWSGCFMVGPLGARWMRSVVLPHRKEIVPGTEPAPRGL